ncbi:plasmid replication/partition related protein [Leptothrix discophora]|uniref:Plasmid replication/partition related protein n=1 Tax=Leptothrix discophora TaxID=89 RepID=A0ABT9FYI5_LEPDI|nr:plasmid replication/partition related protein [Leptothrix discophora]MDP4299300.1 plasmid replication/partition related protein [Leptothrix discophora]
MSDTRIVIDPEIQAYIDPLTPDEHDALERSLVTEGCRDALVLWGELLVDGHNRYGICQKHGLPFRTVQNTRFRSVEDVKLWMIEQHLGRRSLTDFQRGELALRQREIVKARRERQLQEAAERTSQDPATDAPPARDAAPWDVDGAPPVTASADGSPAAAPIAPSALKSREELARAARLSPAQVAMIEKIHQQAAPEVVAAVRAGDLSISAAAAVATLPAEEQVAAASGGKDELKQAARRAREARRKPREDGAADAAADASAETSGGAPDSVEVLRARIAELEAENAALRRQLAALQSA